MSKTKNSKKIRLNPFAVAAIVLCALIVIYCGTTAWITGGAPLNPIRFTQLQDFKYDIEISGATLSDDGAIVFDKDTISKIGDLKVNIKETGNGISYFRIKVSQEWLVPDNVNGDYRLQGATELPLVFGENFFDNREKDGYIYYKGTMPVGGSVSFITGFDSASFDASAFNNAAYSGLKLRIDISVDAVQFNRYRQVWGVDGLPWRGSNA